MTSRRVSSALSGCVQKGCGAGSSAALSPSPTQARSAACTRAEALVTPSLVGMAVADALGTLSNRKVSTRRTSASLGYSSWWKPRSPR